MSKKENHWQKNAQSHQRPVSRRKVIKNLLSVPFVGAYLLSPPGKKEALASYSKTKGGLSSKLSVRNSEVYPRNEPMGAGQGIFPGRVVWTWNPKATNPYCTNTTNENGIHDPEDDAWFMDKNTDQEKVSQMLTDGLLKLTGKKDLSTAWDAIFKHHNKKRGKSNTGYKNGEKILVKINRTSGNFGMKPGLIRTDKEGTLCSETSPQVVLSVLRHLTREAKVPQKSIYLGDPQRGLFKDEYDKYYAEFPRVNYLYTPEKGNSNLVASDKPLLFYSDKKQVMPKGGSDKLYTVMEDAEYLINLPGMKGHAIAGISLFAKNHFGSITKRTAMHMHPGLNKGRPEEDNFGIYRVLVDLMGNKHTGEKNLVYILDALWTGDDWDGYPVKFQMPPFNNHWSSSLFVSMDPVAIESVAFDFLRTEFSQKEHLREYVTKPGIDDYLHQTADSRNWPENITYMPNGDNIPMPDSLGVHEHWNDPVEKKYSRNLGKKEGIELVKAFS
jgi:hypothetical protein